MNGASLMRGVAALSFLFMTSPLQAQATVALPPFQSEIDGFAAADRASQPEPCGVLFVGSSSIRLWESLATDMAPYRVINRGFGGSTIADVNLHFDRLVAPYRPRAIFLYAGENDIADGRSPQKTVAEFRTFLGKKTRSLGTTPVYFISLKPSKARLDQLERQREVNAAVQRLAAERADLDYVDVASAMLAKGKPRDIFQSDALHMTEAGYRIWTRILRPQVVKAAKHRCVAGRG